MKKRVPKFYFSFRSPYSWMGAHQLRQRAPNMLRKIEWVPYFEPGPVMAQELESRGHPFPYNAMSKDKHRYILQDVRRLSRDAGLNISWPLDSSPNWELAHLGYLAAVEDGLGDAFFWRVCESRWERGENISDPAVIAQAAQDVGLDAGRITTAEDDPHIRAKAVQALCAASKDGVFGVPFFMYGYEKYWGLDRLDGFIDSINPKINVTPGLGEIPPLLPYQPAAMDHAGGCG